MTRDCNRDGSRMRYYDLSRNWTKKIAPHLGDRKLNKILVRDFNMFTLGRWGKRFGPGEFPRDFEICDWEIGHLEICDWEIGHLESCYRDIGHRGRRPPYWAYVKHAACHWLVNFNLRLAGLAEPRRSWRILISDRHSTVWDGDRTLFEMNFAAFGISPQECFEIANVRVLPVGKYRRCYLAEHWKAEQERLAQEAIRPAATRPATCGPTCPLPDPCGRNDHSSWPPTFADQDRCPETVTMKMHDPDHAVSDPTSEGPLEDGFHLGFSRIGRGTDPIGAASTHGDMPNISRSHS